MPRSPSTGPSLPPCGTRGLVYVSRLQHDLDAELGRLGHGDFSVWMAPARGAFASKQGHPSVSCAQKRALEPIYTDQVPANGNLHRWGYHTAPKCLSCGGGEVGTMLHCAMWCSSEKRSELGVLVPLWLLGRSARGGP